MIWLGRKPNTLQNYFERSSFDLFSTNFLTKFTCTFWAYSYQYPLILMKKLQFNLNAKTLPKNAPLSSPLWIIFCIFKLIANDTLNFIELQQSLLVFARFFAVLQSNWGSLRVRREIAKENLPLKSFARKGSTARTIFLVAMRLINSEYESNTWNYE